VALDVEWSRVPLYPGAEEWAAEGVDTGGGKANARFYGEHVLEGAALGLADRVLLFDPQTSGGLLAAVPPEGTSAFLETLERAGERGWEIGRVADAGEPRLRLR
jgi:selenide,water dikinase